MKLNRKVSPALFSGEKILRDEFAKLRVYLLGNRYRTTPGHLFLTLNRLIFSPIADGDGLNGQLDDFTKIECSKRKYLKIPIGSVLSVHLPNTKKPYEFTVDDPTAWMTEIKRCLDSSPARLTLTQQLSFDEPPSKEALRAMLQTERGFPAGFWHIEDAESMTDIMSETFNQLQIPKPIASSALQAAKLVAVPENIDSKMEEAIHFEQVHQAVQVANQKLKSKGDARKFVLLDSSDYESPFCLVSDAELKKLAAFKILNEG